MINKLKSEKGITGIDLTVSLIIITLFISIIVALSANLSTSLASKRRLEVATNCMTEIMEKLDEIDYESVVISSTESENTITDIANRTFTAGTFEAEVKEILSKDEYKILTVDIYKEGYLPEGENLDLVKKVTVKIKYKINNKEEKIEFTRLKTKYNVELWKGKNIWNLKKV